MASATSQSRRIEAPERERRASTVLPEYRREKEPTMRNRSWRKVRLGRVALIAAVLAVASGSSVAMAVRAVRHGETIAPGEIGKARAKCPGDRSAVAGGFAAPGFNPNAGSTIGRIGSRRVGQRKIEARALNFGNQDGELVSFAYCAQNDHGLEVESAKTSVEANSRGAAVAKCPRGTRAVAGGFGTYRFSPQEGPQVIPLTSKRLPERRWKVVGLNINDQNRPGTLIAYAYCADAPFDLITKSREVEAPVGSLRTFDVRCDGDSRAYSGGFDGHIQLAAQPQATVALTSKRAQGSRVWRTSALSIFGPDPSPVTAYAYCRQR
jgi:hypothetical protein